MPATRVIDRLTDLTDYAASVARADRRQLLTLAPPAVLDETCYLWRNFATTGARANEYEIYVPFAEGRFGVYSFRDHIAASGGCIYFGRMKEGVPVINLPSNDAAVTKAGSWSASANAAAYNGTSLRSNAAGDTMTATVTGHTLILRAFTTTNGGFGTVSIDGSFTAATRLPAFTQADVDAGYCASGDIGKRYCQFYSIVYEDEHFVLAEGLSDAAHTVQIRVQGTKLAASSDTRVYVAGFAGATAGTKVTDVNASMGYTREITNLRTASNFSAMDLVPEYTPNGFTNYQFLGNNHGNETLAAQQFLVDGVVSAPASGAYVAGSVIKSELSTNLTHPDTGATVVAAKRSNFVARADRAAQLSCRYRLQYKNAGTNRAAYFGMMHVGTHTYGGTNTLQQTEFNRFLVGDTLISSFSANNESQLGLSHSDIIAAFSTAHDTVAVLSMPRVDLNVDGYSRAGSGAFIQDRADFTEKGYLIRSSASGLESVSPSTVHAGEVQWRVFRVANANARIGF